MSTLTELAQHIARLYPLTDKSAGRRYRVVNQLAGLTELNQENIQAALKEVRQSLLEADVELGVTKRFLARVEKRAQGVTVQTKVKHGDQVHRVSAGDQFVKICHDELVEIMRHDGEPLEFAARGPTGIMMVGLQGSGKTTSTAKLARYFLNEGKKPLLVAADMQRPAAARLRVRTPHSARQGIAYTGPGRRQSPVSPTASSNQVWT